MGSPQVFLRLERFILLDAFALPLGFDDVGITDAALNGNLGNLDEIGRQMDAIGGSDIALLLGSHGNRRELTFETGGELNSVGGCCDGNLLCHLAVPFDSSLAAYIPTT